MDGTAVVPIDDARSAERPGNLSCDVDGQFSEVEPTIDHLTEGDLISRTSKSRKDKVGSS